MSEKMNVRDWAGYYIAVTFKQSKPIYQGPYRAKARAKEHAEAIERGNPDVTCTVNYWSKHPSELNH